MIIPSPNADCALALESLLEHPFEQRAQDRRGSRDLLTHYVHFLLRTLDHWDSGRKSIKTAVID